MMCVEVLSTALAFHKTLILIPHELRLPWVWLR